MESTGRDSPIYKEARTMRRQRAVLLDEPKGVASLLKNSGPGGINRPVDIEKIPDAVAKKPVDHFDHVITTLQSASSEPTLAPQAQAAINEIRSNLLLGLQEQAQKLKGAWNNRGVTLYLNANRAKFARAFTPTELERLGRDVGGAGISAPARAGAGGLPWESDRRTQALRVHGWYPTGRLFSQQAAGDWRGPVEAAAQALAEITA